MTTSDYLVSFIGTGERGDDKLEESDEARAGGDAEGHLCHLLSFFS